MTNKTGSAGVEIGTRYAAALFDLAQSDDAAVEVASSIFATEETDAEKIEADLIELGALIAQSEDLMTLISSPVLSIDDQKAAITKILQKAQAHEMVVNVAGLMAQNGRLFALPAMIKAFQKMAADARGEVSAEAITATPLTAEQLAELKTQIESSLGKAINLDTKTDESLLGGLIVKVGSRMVDTSLRTKLNQLKLAMKEA